MTITIYADGQAVATQVRPGGLWHAGIEYRADRGIARTACGRWGFVDHLWDPAKGDSPMPATLDTGADVQVIECATCRRWLGGTT